MPQDLPKPIRANFILNVETDELFITAGLQDRVVQVSLMTHGVWTCLWVLTVKLQTLLLCLAGVRRLSVHGFQQGVHGRARLRYWPPCQRAINFISCKIQVVAKSCVCSISTCTLHLENFIISDWLCDVRSGLLQNSQLFSLFGFVVILMLKLSSCVSFHYQEATLLWTWVNFHRSGWPTWVTPVILAVSIATSDSAGSVVCFQIRRYRCSADESYWWWWSHCFLLYWCSVVICCTSPVSILFHHQLRMNESS